MKFKLQAVSRMLAVSLILSLFFGSFGLGRAVVVHADESEGHSGMPELLITEIVANSSGTGELYEYIEIYNATDHRIDLDGYQLQYFTKDAENFPPPANNMWKISGKSIEANSAFVLWLKKFDNPNSPLADFNANYGVELIPEQVFEVRLTTSAQGLANAAKRKVAIANSNGTVISEALINDGTGTADGAAANKDKSVIYKYSGGGIQMERMANGQKATPGVLTPNQTVGPSAPDEVVAEAGDRTVKLTWNSSQRSFKVYYYAAADRNISAVDVHEGTSVQLNDLTNQTDYVFWITALNEDGIESPASRMVKTMPMDASDLLPPAVPSGLTAAAGPNRITLTWDEGTENNLAGYNVYVDGVLFDTVLAPTNRMVISPLQKGERYALSVTAFNFAGLESERSVPIAAGPSDALPELLITELVADTDNFASFDAFEFIELYNASDAAIDLEGYQINAGWEKAIDRSMIIKPGEVAVLWTRRAEIAPITLEAFNSYYFSSYKSKHLSADQVYIIHDVGGLVNGGATVTVKDPEGVEVSKASYVQTDAPLNKSAVYTYPTDGSTVMKLLAGAQKMTPGTVSPEQVPDKRDGNAPQTPSGVQAIAGSGTAIVSWLPSGDTGLFKYNIYKNGVLEHSVPASEREFIIYELTGNTEYRIEVSAVDHLGNESAKSAPITVTPTHLNVTQEERAANPNDSKYQTLWDISGNGPVIPGLVQDLVPQGLTYYKEKDWLLSVYYRNDQRPGVLAVIDAKTDRLIKSVHLYNENGTPYRGHAGGVVVGNKHVMISSEQYMFLIDLEDLINAKDNDEITFKGRLTVDLDAAFATFDDGVLWVGEFYQSASYPTDPSHHIQGRDGSLYYAWIEGFVLDSATDLPSSDKWSGEMTAAAVPDYVLVIPDRIQGVVFADDTIILSQSYGRNNDSTLFRYKNPLNEDAHATAAVGEQIVPLWFLDDQSLREANDKLTVVPMTEGLTVRDGYLYVMLESGANYYRYTTTYVMDRLLKIDLDQWDKFGVKYIDGLPAEVRAGNTLQARVVEGKGKHEPVDYTTEYSFSSSNEEVIAITAAGQATAKKAGEAIVTAVSGSHTLSYRVKVTSAPNPPENPSPDVPATNPPDTKPDPEEDQPLTSKVTAEEQQAVNKTVEQYVKLANARLTVLGDAFAYHAAKDGKPQTVKLSVQWPANDAPVGVYEVGGNGELTYAGGKRKGAQIEVELNREGVYVVLAYDKSFADLQSGHWAYDAIRQLSAMQIIKGVNATDFAPKQDVTRAEFIAMLVRSLGLKAAQAASFADVPSDSWYAEPMAAAVEAGLIVGMEDGTLAPNARLTREQMALLLVRAYQIKTGEMAQSANKNANAMPFSDRAAIGGWARDGVNDAYQLGLMSGHANGMFMPKNTAARAEAAKAIANLFTTTGEW